MHHMDVGCIPKDLLNGELTNVPRVRGHPTLCYKDACKCDMRDAKINITAWERLAEDCRAWTSAVRSWAEGAEADRMEQLVQKKVKRKEGSSSLLQRLPLPH